MPDDLLTVAGGSPQTENEDHHTEQTDSSVLPSIIFRLGRSERADQNNAHAQHGRTGCSELLGDEAHERARGMLPDPVHGFGDDGDGHVEENDAQSDS